MKTLAERCHPTLIGCLAVALLIPNALVAGEGWRASPETVRSGSKSQPGFNFDEAKVPDYALPDVLTTFSGRRVSSKEEWLKLRRPELLETFTARMFGRVPSTPYKISFDVVREDRNQMNGTATLRLVDIRIVSGEKSLAIHLGLFAPNNGPKPAPAFLLICNRPTDNIDFTREKKSEFWPAEEAVARGYAIAAFYNADVDPDTFDDFKNGIHGVLDRERNDESWATLAAWAWSASRCLDYFETDKDIDARRVAVVGHSRGGKTALWAGATDERFAMIVSNEAGCGGSSLARRRYGETIARITKSFPHWFCANYKQYANNEDALPFDQHMLMALIAPRALYVASADKDLWGDPKGQYLALFHSLPAFKLWDPKLELPEAMPPLDTPARSGQIAYHVRDGSHNLLLKDWNWFMDQADVVLKKR